MYVCMFVSLGFSCCYILIQLDSDIVNRQHLNSLASGGIQALRPQIPKCSRFTIS